MRFSLLLPTLLVAATAGCSDGPNEPDTSLRLDVGKVFIASGAEADTLTIRGGAGAEYTLIPFFGTEANGATLALDITGQGIAPVVGPPNPAAIPDALFSRTPASLGTSDSGTDAFHRRLREYERDLLSAHRGVAGGATPNFSRSAATRAVPQVGEVISINTGTSSTNLCSAFSGRSGRVAAVSQRAIIVADVVNPAGGFTDEEYRSFGAAFDTLVYPVNVENFGEPSDLDQNQRSIVFFTRAVNQLTPANVQYVIGGYFFGGDLLLPDQCLASNRGEFFYMLVPDPAGEVNGNVRTKESLLRSTVATLGHEFQHLINASRRIANNAGGEEVWLNEGLSHIAEELLFYRTSGLGPRQNIDITRLRASQQALNAVNTYQLSNIFRYIEYLENPEANSPYQRSDSLAVRGATWSFLRYAADRRNGSDAQLWKQLVEARTSGLENLKTALGSEAIPRIRDWTVSVYADDAGFPVDAAYTQPSWNFRSLILAFRNQQGQPSYPQYPLKVRPLAEATPLNVTLKGRGAAAFVRFATGASGETLINMATTGGGALPATVQVAVVRTK